MDILANLDYLKVFYFAAKYNSITRAARELYLSQPAATRILHSLEAQLDCLLFIRNSRGVTLTPEGNILYQELIPAFEAIEQAQIKLQQMHSLENGFIHVAVNNLATEYLMKYFSKDFKTVFPGITITASRIDIAHIVDSLKNDWIDFAILIDIGNQHSDEDMFSFENLERNNIVATDIGSYQDCFLVGPRYAYMSEHEVSFQELSALPLIVPIKQRSSVKYYLKMLRGSEVPSPIDMTVNGAESRLALAQRNLGVTFFPEAFVKDDIQDKKLFRVKSNIPMKTSTVYLLTNKNASQNVAAQKLIDMIRKTL